MLILAGAGMGRWQSKAREAGGFSPVDTFFQSVVGWIGRPLDGSIDGTSDLILGMRSGRTLRIQNDAMKARLLSLSLYEQRVRLLETELGQLRQLSGFPQLPGRTRVPADVIGFNSYESRITLNVGAEKGIQPNMPVINGDGLVGLVREVRKGECQVVLLTAFGVDVGGLDVTRNPPALGFVKGQGAAALRMVMFDPKAVIASGDMVTTSGLGMFLPRGIPIGRVINVKEDPELGTRVATLEPNVQVGTLREVQVLK